MVAIQPFLGLASAWGQSPAVLDDLKIIRKTLDNALDTLPEGGTADWTNPNTGHSGSVSVGKSSRGADGQVCRNYQRKWIFEGGTSTFDGLACMSSAGLWRVQNERNMGRVRVAGSTGNTQLPEPPGRTTQETVASATAPTPAPAPQTEALAASPPTSATAATSAAGGSGTAAAPTGRTSAPTQTAATTGTKKTTSTSKTTAAKPVAGAGQGETATASSPAPSPARETPQATTSAAATPPSAPPAPKPESPPAVAASPSTAAPVPPPPPPATPPTPPAAVAPKPPPASLPASPPKSAEQQQVAFVPVSAGRPETPLSRLPTPSVIR